VEKICPSNKQSVAKGIPLTKPESKARRPYQLALAYQAPC